MVLASCCEVASRALSLSLFGAAFRWGLCAYLAVDFIVKGGLAALTESRGGLRAAFLVFAPINLAVLWVRPFDDTPWSALLVLHGVAGVLLLCLPAFLGVGSLMRATEGAALQDMTAIHVLDGLFGVWAVSSAWFLWRGEIRAEG